MKELLSWLIHMLILCFKSIFLLIFLTFCALAGGVELVYVKIRHC